MELGVPGDRADLRPLFSPSQAVCCPDHIHCCPQGYTCDPAGGSCLQEGGERRPWLRKTPALAREGDVRCDEKTSCPDGNTCCRLSSGAWACCPLEEVQGGPALWDGGCCMGARTWGDPQQGGGPGRCTQGSRVGWAGLRPEGTRVSWGAPECPWRGGVTD